MKRESRQMRAWIDRRESAGKPWTSDELWNAIKIRWPSHSDADLEQIYQESAGYPRRRRVKGVQP